MEFSLYILEACTAFRSLCGTPWLEVSFSKLIRRNAINRKHREHIASPTSPQTSSEQHQHIVNSSPKSHQQHITKALSPYYGILPSLAPARDCNSTPGRLCGVFFWLAVAGWLAAGSGWRRSRRLAAVAAAGGWLAAAGWLAAGNGWRRSMIQKYNPKYTKSISKVYPEVLGKGQGSFKTFSGTARAVHV
jgi:hypothetical protein